MTWEYILIGFIAGVIIGALIMRFVHPKLKQLSLLQNELNQNKKELEQYRNELINHFAQSADLLNKMAQDYRQLYQHMIESSNHLLPDLPTQHNPFKGKIEVTEAEADNEHPLVEIPKDYSDEASGLLKAERR